MKRGKMLLTMSASAAAEVRRLFNMGKLGDLVESMEPDKHVTDGVVYVLVNSSNMHGLKQAVTQGMLNNLGIIFYTIKSW